MDGSDRLAWLELGMLRPSCVMQIISSGFIFYLFIFLVIPVKFPKWQVPLSYSICRIQCFPLYSLQLLRLASPTFLCSTSFPFQFDLLRLSQVKDSKRESLSSPERILFKSCVNSPQITGDVICTGAFLKLFPTYSRLLSCAWPD